MTAPTPQEIAREAVKLLTARKLPPTPENFQTFYHEVAGTRPLKPFPLENLRQIAQALPDGTPAQQRFKSQFGKAVSMHSWDDLERVLSQQLRSQSASAEAPAPTPVALAPVVQEQERLPPELLEQMARIVGNALPAVGNDDRKVVELADELMNYLRLPEQHPPSLRKLMADFAFRLSFVAEEQAAIRETLLKLLHAVLDNVRAVNLEQPWLQKQLGALIEVAQPPLSIRRLQEAQSRLKDLTRLQLDTKEQMLEAQNAMKETLAVFMQRLSETAASSEQYQQRFEHFAHQLERSTSLAEMTPVLQQAIQSARSLALDSQRTGVDLGALRERASQAEAQVEQLRLELQRASEQASHDALTGALNRKGMAEVLERETSRAQRLGSSLCLALLDLDDFKRLNDRLGHLSGDAALQHLATVAKAALRPHDSLARYGGEEFVVILPDIEPDEALEVMRRVQRELTTQLFLSGSERVLITFSAGVTQLFENETLTQALERADQAMYAAKRTGKNRVLRA
jgi:diguanylate cyclase